jgi:TonB family protein
MGRNLFAIIKGGFFAGAALVSCAALAEEPAPVVLKPSSDWHVDYAADSCRLARTFGEGEQKSVMYFERYEPGDAFYFLVAGAPLKHERVNAKTSFQFGPGGREHTAGWTMGTLGELDPALMVNGLTLMPIGDPKRASRRFDPKTAAQDTDIFGQEISPGQERTIEWLEIQRGKSAPVRFELGSMGPPMQALRACTDELMEHWGLDLDAHRTLSRAAAPASIPGNWLNSNDYPKDLLRQHKAGLVQFRLTVGADGKPTHCNIQRSTRPEGFDKAVCEGLMRRARFTPALDANGQAIASFWRSAVHFDVPN